MRDQAKKMNVASLRSSEAQKTSTETKLAKVRLFQLHTICDFNDAKCMRFIFHTSY